MFSGEGRADVLGGDRRVELVGLRHLAREMDNLARECAGRLCGELALMLFLLGTALDFFGVALAHGGSGNERLPLREEVVKGEAVLHNDDVVALADAVDIFQEEEFHRGEGIGQHRLKRAGTVYASPRETSMLAQRDTHRLARMEIPSMAVAHLREGSATSGRTSSSRPRA